LKVNDENSRIRIQDLDPLARSMDPRIRIHPKMSWIRNTGSRLKILNIFMWIRDLSAAGSGIPGFRIRIDFMYTDPDPAFFLIADPDPGSGSRV
jgi:hypothetical protein